MSQKDQRVQQECFIYSKHPKIEYRGQMNEHGSLPISVFDLVSFRHLGSQSELGPISLEITMPNFPQRALMRFSSKRLTVEVGTDRYLKNCSTKHVTWIH